MSSFAIHYPPEVLNALQQEPEEFEAEARLTLALKLYGRLGWSEFLFLLGKHGLSPFGEAPDELAQDLEDARRAGTAAPW